jgi:hypothetical protein
MSILIKSTKILIAMGLAALIAACPALGVKTVGPALSGAEIKKLIVGNTLQGPAGTELYDWYYQSDGAVTGVIGASNDDSGTWLIKDSNVYCHTWDQYFDGVQNCYQFFKVADSSRYVMKNVDADRGSNIDIWAVRKGNPFNM